MAHEEPTAEVMVFSMAWDQPEPFDPGKHAATAWEQARQRLADADSYWLSTVRPDGRPHLVPLLGVWLDDALHFCASTRSRKARNLAHRPHCSITASVPTLDLVVEGRAVPVTDETRLQRAAETYASKYGWRPEVRDQALWADGAPTAGPPPYQLYEVAPAIAFGFPTDEGVTPTRWRF